MRKLGVLLLVLSTLAVFLSGCDLTAGFPSTLAGDWTVTFFYNINEDEDTFEVSKWTLNNDGTFIEKFGVEEFSGTWSASGSDITMNYNEWDNAVVTGKISFDKNTMMGAFENDVDSGSWMASRNSASLPKSTIGMTPRLHPRK